MLSSLQAFAGQCWYSVWNTHTRNHNVFEKVSQKWPYQSVAGFQGAEKSPLDTTFTTLNFFSSHPSIFFILLFSIFFHVHFSFQFHLFSWKKQVNEQWMVWLRLQRSEASLSLLIKLSAWRVIGCTKAWNCLTFFLLTHSAISHFLSYISQRGGQQ